MTYDWNKMVEITVPVGINGWVYAGSVTINGVTVDFPIGIPTSVPEPVAELLKKFIALEEDKNKVPTPGAGDGGVQPDWEQNDPKAADYVKNRTHYKGTADVVLLDNAVVTFATNENFGGYCVGVVNVAESVTAVPTEIRVIWDGVNYTCTNVGGAYGNLSIVGGGADTGEPFMCSFMRNTSILFFSKDVTEGQHTITANAEMTVTHKLPMEYIDTDSITRNTSAFQMVSAISGVTTHEEVASILDKVYGKKLIILVADDSDGVVKRVLCLDSAYDTSSTHEYIEFHRAIQLANGNSTYVNVLMKVMLYFENDVFTHAQLVYPTQLRLGDYEIKVNNQGQIYATNVVASE